MRVQLSQQAIRLLYQLGLEGSELRRALESLKREPVPEWALPVEGYANRYEFFVAGYWIIYEVDRSLGETVVIVSAIEEN
jgi:hypothetical protein